MRRLAPLLGVSLVLAGCGGGQTVLPTAEKVIGTVPTTTQAAAPAGNAKAGAALFKAQGCGGCHVFTPAGTNGKIGPDLDKLAQYAQQANRGSLTEFTRESIADPGAYLQPGYKNVMPNFGQTLSPKQISDLVAYLTKG
jgi:cytochrome c oxidase subunit II